MKSLIPCIIALAFAAPAAASDVRPARSAPDALETTVSFAGLDLDRTSGADLLLSRLHHAARAVCGEAPAPRELAQRNRHRACLASAVDNAVASVDAPLVTARHTGRDTSRMAD